MASAGALAKLCMEPGAAPHTFDTSSEPYAFLSETLKLQATHIDNNAIRGTRSHAKETIREGTEFVTGSVVLHPSPADLDLLLPRILGANESSDTFALAETVPAFGILVDRVGGTHAFADCKVNRATFRSGPNGLLELTLDILGVSETVGTAYPALTLPTDAHDAPYVHHDVSGAVTLGGTAYNTIDVEIVIDNALIVSHYNSQTPTAITAGDRTITLRTTHPFTSTERAALYGVALAGLSTNTVVYTNGNMSTTFTFANLKSPDDDAVNVAGKDEVVMRRLWTAYKSGATEPLVVTHDSTA